MNSTVLSSTNGGIRNYLSLQLLKKIHYLLPLLKFVMRLKHSSKHFINNVYVMNSRKIHFNAFKEAMNICRDNSHCAFYILSFFGHDNVTQYIDSPLPIKNIVLDAIISFLNRNLPKHYNLLYAQGALDNIELTAHFSVHKIKKNLEKLKLLVRKFNSLSQEKMSFGNSEFQKNFRLGYYHLYGSSLVTLKLFEDENALLQGVEMSKELPPYLVEAYKTNNLIGYIKRNQLISSLHEMELIDKYKIENSFISKKLISFDKINFLNSPKQIATHIKDLVIDINLQHIEYAKEQHLRAAEFTTKELKSYIKNYCQ